MQEELDESQCSRADPPAPNFKVGVSLPNGLVISHRTNRQGFARRV